LILKLGYRQAFDRKMRTREFVAGSLPKRGKIGAMRGRRLKSFVSRCCEAIARIAVRLILGRVATCPALEKEQAQFSRAVILLPFVGATLAIIIPNLILAS
jgi:hypothetical protein